MKVDPWTTLEAKSITWINSPFADLLISFCGSPYFNHKAENATSVGICNSATCIAYADPISKAKTILPEEANDIALSC